MGKEREAEDRAGERPPGPEVEGASCCGEGSERWGFGDAPGMKMMQACPCRGMVERHRRALYAALVGIGLAMLLLPIGWILGVIAFFRTI